MARSWRWPFFLIAALCLCLGLWGFRAQVREGSLPADFGEENLEYPLTVEDRVAGSPAELRFLVQGWPPGHELLIEDSSGGLFRVELQRSFTVHYFVVTLLSGLFFWVVATFVFGNRIRQPNVPDFFWLTMMYGLAILIGGVFYQPNPYHPRAVIPLLQFCCLAFLPLTLVHLALDFPRRNPILDRRRMLMPALWVLSSGIVIWQAAVFWRYFTLPSPERFATLWLPQIVADVLMIIMAGAGLLILFATSARSELTRERKQTRWLLWGFAVGAAPYVFLRTLPQLAGLSPPLPPFFDRIMEIAMPTSFIFAVVYYQFLDIDIIIRRSLIYGLLAAGLVVLVPIPVLTLGRKLAAQSPAWIPLAVAACGLLAGLLFSPVRRLIGSWVDRAFFKIEHDYESGLDEFAGQLDGVSSLSELSSRIADFLSRMLGPRRLAVILVDGQDLEVTGDIESGQGNEWLTLCRRLASANGAPVAAQGTTSLPEIESAEFPAALSDKGIAVVQPLVSEEGLQGLILFSKRETERRFIEPDIACLAKCAHLATEAARRIQLVKKIAQETLYRRQLDELNSLKSDFLLRVAHDLRNPLAAIDWSVENLLDGLAGELNQRQSTYLGSVKDAVTHLNGLVNNLLEISRLEQSKPELELERLGLEPLLQSIVSAASLQAESRNITLRIDIEPVGLAVLGHEARLRDVLVNLLDNALKYSPEEQPVEIAARRSGPDQVEISVRDHGPGLEDLANAFDRFVQGRPSSHATQHGFGLGLYIVREYLQLMGGQVRGENHPEGGAVFRCLLPAAVPGEE